jgi:hypothetical protein
MAVNVQTTAHFYRLSDFRERIAGISYLVSEATLNPEHLLTNYAEFLVCIRGYRTKAQKLHNEGLRAIKNEDYEALGWVLEDMTDMLDTIAGPNHYFGANEGNGSDIGFFPISEDDDY